MGKIGGVIREFYSCLCSVILAEPLDNGGIFGRVLMCGTLQSGRDIQDARLPGPGALGQGWGQGLQVGPGGRACREHNILTWVNSHLIPSTDELELHFGRLGLVFLALWSLFKYFDKIIG